MHQYYISFQLPLFRQEEGGLVLNVDPQIPLLIQEAKWMLRMKLEVPETAKLVLSREKRFKHYKNHLEQCLHDYHEVLFIT